MLARLPLSSGMLAGKLTRASKFAADDHRSYNREGEHWDKGETFSGVHYEAGLPAVEDLRKLVPKETKMATFALRWILMHDEVTCVIPGAKRPDQVDDNCDAGDLPALSDETMAAVLRDLREADQETRPLVLVIPGRGRGERRRADPGFGRQPAGDGDRGAAARGRGGGGAPERGSVGADGARPRGRGGAGARVGRRRGQRRHGADRAAAAARAAAGDPAVRSGAGGVRARDAERGGDSEHVQRRGARAGAGDPAGAGRGGDPPPGGRGARGAAAQAAAVAVAAAAGSRARRRGADAVGVVAAATVFFTKTLGLRMLDALYFVWTTV